MAETIVQIQAPEPPDFPGFPDKRKLEWKQNWLKAFKQAQIDHPGDEITQRAVATREANRVFRVEEPTGYDDAMALEEWQFLLRAEKGGQLKLVTIDGKKYSFPIPAAKAQAQKQQPGSNNGNGPDLSAMTKNELVAHAATRGIDLDPNSKKEEMIARITAGK